MVSGREEEITRSISSGPERGQVRYHVHNGDKHRHVEAYAGFPAGGTCYQTTRWWGTIAVMSQHAPLAGDRRERP